MIVALLALLVAILIGGGAADSKELEKQVKAQISDKARGKEIIVIAQKRDKDLKGMEKALGAGFEELIRVHRDFGTTAADFDAVEVQLVKNQQAIAKTMLDARDAMKKQMNREEWTAVFSPALDKKAKK